MSASGRIDDTSSGGELEEESADAKIERLTTEIDELKASLTGGVPEWSDEWIKIKTDIKDKDTKRLLLIEKKRCDDVVKEYFEENPHVLEAVPECPICFEKIWTRSVSMLCLLRKAYLQEMLFPRAQVASNLPPLQRKGARTG